jgi:NADP-dependent 3-hydroxy acid dehydrogenase YdfG
VSRLGGQIAVVTGASGAIGGALATALAAEGAELILVGRDRARLEALAAKLAGRALQVALCDFDDPAEPARLATRLRDEGVGVDILAHAAGLFAEGDLEAADDRVFARLLRVNLQAPLELTRGLLPSLRYRRGQIVFVNSSVTGRRGVGLYAASKHGLRAIADSLRDEVNGDGVRVVSVYPGRTASAMQQAVHRAEGRAYDPARLVQPEDIARAVLGALLLERTAEITELHIRPMRP